MKQSQFELHARSRWQAYERDLLVLEGATTGQLDRQQFIVRYRALCRDLALATERGYSTLLAEQLNDWVLRGHNVMYVRRSGFWQAARDFFVAGFPRLVRSEWRLVLTATLLFVLPMVLVSIAIAVEPKAVYYVLDQSDVQRFEQMYDRDNEVFGRDRDAGGDFQMFGYYIYNNTSIGFQCFATGLLAGVGPLFFLFYNGLVIGAVMAYLASSGYGDTFFPFVVGHGSFELTAIVLSGVAGLRLGIGLLAPGRNSRARSLQLAGRQSVNMVFGIFVMFVVAAFIEAFWSSIGALPSAVKYTVGGLLWTLVIGYFLFAGRKDPA